MEQFLVVFGDWLYDYQTLVAGGLAVAGTFLALRATRRQINLTSISALRDDRAALGVTIDRLKDIISATRQIHAAFDEGGEIVAVPKAGTLPDDRAMRIRELFKRYKDNLLAIDREIRAHAMAIHRFPEIAQKVGEVRDRSRNARSEMEALSSYYEANREVDWSTVELFQAAVTTLSEECKEAQRLCHDGIAKVDAEIRDLRA